MYNLQQKLGLAFVVVIGLALALSACTSLFNKSANRATLPPPPSKFQL